MFLKRTIPPRIAAKTNRLVIFVRVVFWLGVLLILASPFIDGVAAYQEGRHGQSFLGWQMDLDLLWLVIVLCLFVTAIVSSLLLGQRSRNIWFRLLLAFLIVFGSPVYFFTATIYLCEPPITLYGRGYTATVRKEVNLVELQKWATQVLRQAPPSENSRQADWNRLPPMPANARTFFNVTTNTYAFFDFADEERRNRSNFSFFTIAGVLRLGDTNFILPTNDFPNCEIAPGIYLSQGYR